MNVMAGKEKPTPQGTAPAGERIAKVLSRRGVASRREAERLIEAGEVTVNGKIITSPALNVTDADLITISGHPLPRLEPARLWLYYKPDGLVTSASDEKGRDTVFDHLPEDLPRVMSVGRLDLNSEGLLLLTNDGELKRRLELPSTGWLRKYRVRVNGNPTDPDLEPLRKGITVEGEKFQPMNVVLDRHQGANAWLTVGLREGKNREIRRAMAAINLTVNRLIRVSYGPFRLGELKPGEVEEVRPKVLREQLGEGGGQDAPDPAARKPRNAAQTAAKRSRPGDGVRALARAWDDAAGEGRTMTEGPKSPARRVTTTSRGTSLDDDDRNTRSPRGAVLSGKPRSAAAPRRSAGEAAEPAPRSFGTAKTFSTTKSAAPSAPRPRREAPNADRPSAKPFARDARDARSPDRGSDRGPKPFAAKPSGAKSGADRAAKPGAPRPTTPKGAAPKAAAPKIAGPKIAGPRGPKPPTRPRKG
ncbi:pseudouridine synthase [Tabrizicola sp.]|uniref:pseudouridine synthase n=1 Tax=Tabrizicola sp. TaxID=2005166 RepID=UPI003D26E4D3